MLINLAYKTGFVHYLPFKVRMLFLKPKWHFRRKFFCLHTFCPNIHCLISPSNWRRLLSKYQTETFEASKTTAFLFLFKTTFLKTILAICTDTGKVVYYETYRQESDKGRKSAQRKSEALKTKFVFVLLDIRLFSDALFGVISENFSCVCFFI